MNALPQTTQQIDPIYAYPYDTASGSAEQMSPATAMAALTLDPFAVIPPNPAPAFSPDATIDMLTRRIAQLEQQLQAVQQQQRTPAGTVNPAHLFIVNSGVPAAASATLIRPDDHQMRTERRETLRKVLNRNGNRCCAWCEPRREPRKYGPRQVPEDKMTCGCTVEDALFEETLARNGVGSMETGRQRLDPELRHALLVLLQKRYRYQDGDFDFDHDTLIWESGGDAASWMARDKFEVPI